MGAREAGEFAGTDRFVVQGRLGAGGYGVVYRALDRQRNIPVALKTLRRLAPKALVRFKQEFRALADVSHPNLATLYELSSHEDQWFFTMELVDGVNFLCYVRGESSPSESGSTSAVSDPTSSNLRAFFDEPQRTASAVSAPPAGALSLDRLRHALPQLVQGVIALHEAGKMHRDIKPSNVLVTREGRVVLLDFGLVAEIAPAQSDSQDAVGTPAYMSPEQMAGRILTPASDWYNVGSMLYQALTGQIPFAGTLLDVMRRKQESEPPSPAEVSPGVPPDLDALCRGLLRRDPERRPSGPDVREALREVKATVTAAPPAPAAAGSAPFVGRERQLAELRDAFARLKQGRALTVAVHGGSGMGKSALVRRFLEELRETDPEAVVLAGRCYERESVPYKALDALVDALSRYLRRLPSAQAEAYLPHDILALARVFPVVRQVKAVSRARRAVLEIPDSMELRRRAFAALRELLVRLADRRALVLFIDDLQWGDADSAALLEALLRPPDPPVLLLIGCYRSEEAETSPLLKTILPKRLAVDPSLEMRDIVLGELSAAEAAELARALVGGPPGEREARADTIARESGGNPFFIEELVRFSSAGARPVAADVTFDHVIETRVSRLPEVARRLLDVVAVSGVPIEVGVAYRAADLEKEGESVLAMLRVAHLVRTRSTLSRHEIETYHDRIRDAVVARLSPELLRECHHRLASALLATGRADPETLATHYLGLGDVESAAEYAAVAAAKASEALAFDHAASLYRFALNLVSATAERANLEVQLGDALARAGRGVDAATAYLSAAKNVGPALGIEVQRRAAQQLYMSGHIEAGEQALEGVLAKLNMKLPKTPRVALLSLLMRRVQVRLRGLRFKERDETQISAQDLLRIDTCWAVGVGLGIVDMVRGADFQARHLVLALRAGEPYRVARALAMEGAYVSMGGNRNRKRSQRLLQAAHALADRVKQPYAIGLATLTSGNAAMLDGRWRDGRGLCAQAEQILRDRSAGVDWEILIAQLCGLACTFFLGEVAALSQRQRTLREEAEGRGSRLRAAFLRTGFCSHIAWLAADQGGRAREELDAGLSGWRQSERFDYLRLWVRGARTDIALYAGEEPGAAEGVGKELRASARALERFVQMGFIRGIDSRARRRLAMAAQATGGSERSELLRGVDAHADAIVKEKTRWGSPLAFLLRAGAAATRGEHERALPLLESAEAGLSAADMALHAVVCRRRRGELLGGDAGRELVAAADAWMAGQGIRRPERMAAMLAPGRWP